MSENLKTHRKIRSFVIREGRMTSGQQRGLDLGWDKFGLQITDGMLDFAKTFSNCHPVILEIGFGMGQSLLKMAQANSDNNYIGIEVHRPGVGALLKNLLVESVNNVRIYNEDAIEVLTQCIPNHSLAGVQLYFPDPWHKKRHHKRRIVQLPFVEQVRLKLQTGGYCHMATDWQDYAEQMMAVMSQVSGLKNHYGSGQFAQDQPNNRPLTKFEQRGKKLGHGVWDLLFTVL